MIESCDALSEALLGLRPHGWVTEEQRLATAGTVSSNGMAWRFYCVTQGDCRLQIDGHGDAARLTAGDAVVVMPGVVHTLHADSKRETTSQQAETSPEADATRVMSGGLQFAGEDRHLLPAVLPAFVIVNGTCGQTAPWLADLLRALAREVESSQPGRQAIVEHLLQALFVQSLRVALTTQPVAEYCGLKALLDSEIGPALHLMHADPQLRWTVAGLARRVGMSRSVFAARFKELVSKSPGQYLLECRMEKARTLLNEGQCGLKQIATRVGYATGAAFSNAFKRQYGAAPGAYRRGTAACMAPRRCGR